MKHCPQCLTEYSDDATDCVDCQVQLVPGPPAAAKPEDAGEPDVKLVSARVFYGASAGMAAEAAKEVLSGQGISAVLTGEFSSETFPGVDAVQLLVRADEASRAAELIEGFFDNPTGVTADAEEASSESADGSLKD